MKRTRRQFVQGVGVASLGLLSGCALPFLQPRQPARVPRVGYLSGGTDSSVVEAFQQGLRDLGYVEGQNIVVDYRFAPETIEQLPDLAAELVALQVDVIVATGIAGIRAAMNASRTIPIVFPNAGIDPVAVGLVASYARPGGNVTGLTGIYTELRGKQLELLKEAVPSIAGVAVLWDAANPDKLLELRATQVVAEALGIQVQSLEVRGASDWEGAFAAALRERADAVFVLQDTLTGAQRRRTVELALQHGLPTMFTEKTSVELGGLMFYGGKVAAMARRAATYVDKILKGGNPAELPIERPREFELVINLKTAQALGLTIPPHVLLQATEVIQ